ncbi:MAG: PAS domain-containing protein, partial [Candidatus Cloacimonetes bacterium]|nr:PAS domain-containing protein [Candidatus Cloacimonadota bacterium]
MSIAKRLLISILSVSVIAFLIIMLVFMISLRKSLEKSAMKTAEEMTFRYVNYVDSELESILSRAKVIAQFIPLMTNRRYKQEELDQIFLEKLENNDHYISIWTYSEIPNSSIENRLYQKNHSTYSRLTHEDIFYFDLKDTYQKVIKHNHEMITAPFFILDKQQIICSLVIPVMKDSVFAGIIGIDLNVFYIKEKLNEIKPWSEGYFILVDNTGRRISHIRPDLLSKPVGDDTPAVKEDLLKAIRNGEGFSFSKYALGTGKLSLMTYQPIKIGENPDPWSLCLVLPMYKVLEEANYLTAFLAVISLIFLCVITFSIFKNISLLKHSIFNINNESKRIIHAVESSNLSVRANVNVVKPDFRLIIHSFNEILDKIEQKDKEKQIINTELLNTKNLLDNIIESSPSLLVAFDKDYRVYLWNYATEQYTHIPAKQAIGKNLYDLFPEVLPFSTFISEVFEQNKEMVIRHQSIKSDNSFFNLYVYPLNDKTDRHA